MAARAVLQAYRHRDVVLREFRARFASVVYPGDTLLVEMWTMGEVGSDTLKRVDRAIEVRVRATVREGGRVALKDAYAVLQLPGRETGKL